MNIEKINDNGKIIISPDGWLDAVTSPELGEAIDSVEDAEAIVLDFEKVEYMSSAGLRQVLLANRKAKSLSASFEVINVGTEVMNIFKMTGIDEKLTIKEKKSS